MKGSRFNNAVLVLGTTVTNWLWDIQHVGYNTTYTCGFSFDEAKRDLNTQQTWSIEGHEEHE